MSPEAEYLTAEAPNVEPPAMTPSGLVAADMAEPPLSEELPEENQRRVVATVLSVAVNLLILMLLVWWAVTPNPVPTKPIPISIVSQIPQQMPPPPAGAKPPEQPKPPPPKPPQPKPPEPKPPEPKPKQKPPPPPKPDQNHGHQPLASDDLGNPDAPKDSKLMTDSSGGGPDQLVDGSEATHDTGTTALAPSPDAPSMDALGDKSEKLKKVEKPMPKKGGSKVSLDPNKTPHAAGKYAKLAGPPATRDEYLAYIKTLIVQQLDSRIMAANGNRHGHVMLGITILPSGHVNFVVVQRSSGWKDIDSRFVQLVYHVGELPPVPARFNDGDSALPIMVTFFAPF